MNRQYSVTPTMFMDRFTEKVVQPDAMLVAQLHALLDLIPDDTHALGIDLCVSQLLRFHDPNVSGRLRPPEIVEARS